MMEDSRPRSMSISPTPQISESKATPASFRILKRGEKINHDEEREKKELMNEEKRRQKSLRVTAPEFIPSGSGYSPSKPKISKKIVQVWADNLQKEFEKICEIVDEYPFIAMDTEFPGIVARPVGSFVDSYDYHYQTVKCNVDLLKIIQLGLTFCDEDGNFRPGTCTWQFNFSFNLSEDMYAEDSIEMLAASGVDFDQHQRRGIDVKEFAALLTQSGLVLNDEVRWISFHSAYDFAYLLKILTDKPLPKTEHELFELLRAFFPAFYDVKFVMKYCDALNGGLDKIAEILKIERIGPSHTAGSDSLLTAAIFYRFVNTIFKTT